MASKWHQTVKQPGNCWWQVGTNKENRLWLPKEWIHVGKSINSQFDKNQDWEVRAARKINPKTMYGHSLFFRTEKQACEYARKYRRKY